MSWWNPFKKEPERAYRPPGFYDANYLEKKWHSPGPPATTTPPQGAEPPSYAKQAQAHDVAIARDRAREQPSFRPARPAAPKAPPSQQKQKQTEAGD